MANLLQSPGTDRQSRSRRATPVSADEQLTRLLEAVRDGRYASSPVDNQMLAAAMQVPLGSVAEFLQEATARRLVSGTRSGGRPGPWYTDLELTGRGRSFLARGDAPSAR
jgi:hypothetical protein